MPQYIKQFLLFAILIRDQAYIFLIAQNKNRSYVWSYNFDIYFLSGLAIFKNLPLCLLVDHIPFQLFNYVQILVKSTYCYEYAS